MGRFRTVFLPLLLLASCGDDGRPKPAAAAKIVKSNPDAASVWPQLLQHCNRAPSCDPMSNFGQGVGQASGVAGSTAWFVESKDVVKEGGQDYGAAIYLSAFGPRGIGGKGGRPLTLDETPNNLRGTNSRRSRLWVEYRTPGGGPPEPYTLSFFSARVAVTPPGIETAKSQEDIMNLTSRYFDTMHWGKPDDFETTGAKIEILHNKTLLFTGYSMGIASAELVSDKAAVRRGFEPWFFYVSRNIRDEPVPELMKALERGATLNLKITRIGGDVILEDGIYADGFSEALMQATSALGDAELSTPLSERCAELKDKEDEFWLKPDVAAVKLVCDPRTPEQRRTDEAHAARKASGAAN
jgi:hypothetical protein